MVAVIMLNWNGFKDTNECLDSLSHLICDDYFVVVGDNGSTNDSLSHIKNHCAEQGYKAFVDIPKTSTKAEKRGIYICDLKTNTGFARGNNTLIEMAKVFDPEYFLLLNNDTTVEPDFLKVLIDFHKSHPQYAYLTPLILYYYERNLVWSAGGWLHLGFRKGYYCRQDRDAIKERVYKECSFITGCALFFDANLLNRYERILTEDFFYGEEDFELSIRSKRDRIKMACVLNSVVYHKVSASSRTTPNLSMTFIHYLNRYIDIRRNYNQSFFFIWEKVNNWYLRRLLIRNGSSRAEVDSFMRKLLGESRRMDKVTKEYFEQTIRKEKRDGE